MKEYAVDVKIIDFHGTSDITRHYVFADTDRQAIAKVASEVRSKISKTSKVEVIDFEEIDSIMTNIYPKWRPRFFDEHTAIYKAKTEDKNWIVGFMYDEFYHQINY